MRARLAPRLAPLFGIAVPAILCAAWGCNAIVDAGSYRVGAVSTSSSSTASTSSPSGDPDGAGACVPGTDRRTLEQACTQADCEPFTTAVPMCGSALCALPGPGATTNDGAAPDASGPADAGAPPDAAGPPGAEAGTQDAGDGGPTSCSHVRSDPRTIVYVTGSTALAAFIGEVSAALAQQVAIVYQQSGSCIGVRSAIDPPNNALTNGNGLPTYYDLNGTQQTCSLDPADGLLADVGASDVFYSTCYFGQAVMLPANVVENFGPVQVMNFAVPQASSQRSISLDAAYYVFGFGGQGYAVPPWTDPTQMQIRSANSGTQSLLAAAIGVPPDQWKGVGHMTSTQVGNALIAAGQSGNQATIDSAIGILASDYLISSTQTLRGLAVQDETRCAYYPNTTAFARDNANARDGHYPLWGPSHFYTRVDPSTHQVKPGVTQLIDSLNGLAPLPGRDLLAEYASKGLIPECAMHVTRTSDLGGDYTPFKPAESCNCYFDLIATGTTTCAPCSTNGDCPASAPNCNKFGPPPQAGYCDL